MFWTIFILSLILVGLAVLALSIKIILFPDKGFPQYRLGENPEMRKRKIFCPRTLQKLIDKDKFDCSGCKF